MDASNFAVQLDLVGSGLMKSIEDQLLQIETENMYIRAELYKLNVYGDSYDAFPASSFLTPLHPPRKRFVLQGTSGYTPGHRHDRVTRDRLSHCPRGRRARAPP